MCHKCRIKNENIEHVAKEVVNDIKIKNKEPVFLQLDYIEWNINGNMVCMQENVHVDLKMIPWILPYKRGISVIRSIKKGKIIWTWTCNYEEGEYELKMHE